MLKDIPDDIKQVLSDAIKQAVQDPELIQQLMDIYTTTDYRDGQDYTDYLNEITDTARAAFGL